MVGVGTGIVHADELVFERRIVLEGDLVLGAVVHGERRAGVDSPHGVRGIGRRRRAGGRMALRERNRVVSCCGKGRVAFCICIGVQQASAFRAIAEIELRLDRSKALNRFKLIRKGKAIVGEAERAYGIVAVCVADRLFVTAGLARVDRPEDFDIAIGERLHALQGLVDRPGADRTAGCLAAVVLGALLERIGKRIRRFPDIGGSADCDNKVVKLRTVRQGAVVFHVG